MILWLSHKYFLQFLPCLICLQVVVSPLQAVWPPLPQLWCCITLSTALAALSSTHCLWPSVSVNTYTSLPFIPFLLNIARIASFPALSTNQPAVLIIAWHGLIREFMCFSWLFILKLQRLPHNARVGHCAITSPLCCILCPLSCWCVWCASGSAAAGASLLHWWYSSLCLIIWSVFVARQHLDIREGTLCSVYHSSNIWQFITLLMSFLHFSLIGLWSNVYCLCSLFFVCKYILMCLLVTFFRVWYTNLLSFVFLHCHNFAVL